MAVPNNMNTVSAIGINHQSHHSHHAHHGTRGPVLEEIQPENKEMLRETFTSYKKARKRISELEKLNFKNDQIILLFVGSLDEHNRIWQADCNPVERAVSYLMRKLQVGGYFIKVHVGNRNEWIDTENPWKKDPKYKVTNLPTIMVLNTFKRISGHRTFDMENIISLLKD